MKCPTCGNMMKAGKMCARGGNGLFWLPADEEVGFFLSDNIIKKHKGIILVGCNKLQIRRSAYICEECRKIIMDY